jgi:uncharacterized membrane protein (DUF106 family)
MNIISLITQYPKIAVSLIAFLLTLGIVIVQFFVLDKEKIRELKAKQKELNAQAKEHRKSGNHEEAMKLSQETMPLALEMMKHTLKPTLITLIPVLVVFAFIRDIFTQTAIAGTWFWWYLGVAIISSIILRKLFKLP